MNYKEIGFNVGQWMLTVLKGAILVLWIVFLSMAAISAINGNIASFFSGFSYFSNNYYSSESQDRKVNQQTREMMQHLVETYGTSNLNVTEVLDYVYPEWAETADKKIKGNPDAGKLEAECKALYQQVVDRFEAYAADPQFNSDQSKLGNDFVTPFFQGEDYMLMPPDSQLGFTPELKSWIVRERESNKSQAARVSLQNTFALLIIIGAFGSLIFLTKDYIFSARTTPFASYIFRPVLGIFLAVSMFVLDIAANAIVSTSDILQVRRETLFLLALAAGLLSEKAYAIIEKKARVALDDFGDKAKSKQGGPGETNAPFAAPEPKTAGA